MADTSQRKTRYQNRGNNTEAERNRLGSSIPQGNEAYVNMLNIGRSEGIPYQNTEDFSQNESSYFTTAKNVYNESEVTLKGLETKKARLSYAATFASNVYTFTAKTSTISEIVNGTFSNQEFQDKAVYNSPTELFDGFNTSFISPATSTGSVTIRIQLYDGSFATKSLKRYNDLGSLVTVSTNDIILNNKYDIVIIGGNAILFGTNINNASQTVAGISYINKQIAISNNATDANNDIDFTSGTFTFSDYTGMARVGAITKRLDASWTAGTNNGGLDTGSKANNTWYHCYAIYNPTSGVSDVIFSTNAITPTLPSGYTKYKLIESILTNSSGNILTFYHEGNYISWKTKIKDISSGLTTSLTPYPISTPLGRSVMVKVRATLFNAGPAIVNILSPYDNSLTPLSSESDLASQGYTTSIEKEVITNTSSQISIIASAAPVATFTCFTYGWEKIN